MIGKVEFTNERHYYVNDMDAMNERLMSLNIKDEQIINVQCLGGSNYSIFYRIKDND